jgi:hypothetical protein
MSADAWRPAPQPPCTDPCCTGAAFTDPDVWPLPAPARDEPEMRECGTPGCTHCDLVTIHTQPAGGGDRLFYGRTTA